MKSLELQQTSYTPEQSSGGFREKFEAFKSRISEIRSRIAEKFGYRDEKLTEATDEALTFTASEVIKEADADGVRTDQELAGINEAVSSVIIEGALEEAGMEKSAGENPIAMLQKDIGSDDLEATIGSLEKEGATLDDGSSISELAAQVIEREYAEIDNITVETEDIFESTPRVKLSETIRDVMASETLRSGETEYRPKKEIICDHSHIEDQRMDIVNRSDKGVTEISFKLREGIEFHPRRVTREGILFGKEPLYFYGLKDDTEQSICQAHRYERDGVKIMIADPQGDEARAMRGYVRIEAPSDMEPERIEEIVKKVVEGDLDIPGGLGEVSEAAELNYKKARYAWQHKIEGELTPEQQEAAEKLEREEVFPGYTTYVERGKHKEYLEEYGDDIRAIHTLFTGDADSIFRMLTIGGMCSAERYKRGLIRNGMSTLQDFKTGGSDSFYTRLTNEDQRIGLGGVNVVFKPEIFDRTDWYTYEKDEYGSIDEETFAERKTPEEMFDITSTKFTMDNNEQMFRTGIGPQYIESILVPPDKRDQLIKELKEMGLVEFDGKPIEKIIISCEDDEEEAAAKEKAKAIFDSIIKKGK
ncbi:hypothetical protein IK110_01895 [Candidatus Saccharibacteria bacterium]|nr:hypothetical protein [Candidatus Saccharibacteria bacterium]